jgi:hypothetical protein
MCLSFSHCIFQIKTLCNMHKKYAFGEISRPAYRYDKLAPPPLSRVRLSVRAAGGSGDPLTAHARSAPSHATAEPDSRARAHTVALSRNHSPSCHTTSGSSEASLKLSIIQTVLQQASNDGKYAKHSPALRCSIFVRVGWLMRWSPSESWRTLNLNATLGAQASNPRLRTKSTPTICTAHAGTGIGKLR